MRLRKFMPLPALALFLLDVVAAQDAPAVLDLGNLADYDARSDKQPPKFASGDAIWLSGGEESGFDIAFSPDLKSKIKQTMDGNCNNAGQKCYEAVNAVLNAAYLDVDAGLSRRHFGHMLSKTVKAGSQGAAMAMAVFFESYNVLLAKWKANQGGFDPPNIYVPHKHASAAGAVAEATEIVVSAAGTAQGTYKPIVATPTITGSLTPALVPITVPTNGLEVGDALFMMDKGLASRLDEMMRRSRDCQEGADFRDGKVQRRQNKPGDRRAWLASVICAVMNTLENAAPGGPFHDLEAGTVNAAGIPPPKDEEMRRALDQILKIADDLAPLLQMSLEEAENFARINFVFGIDMFLDAVNGAVDRGIREINTIRHSWLETIITPDPTASPTPTPTGSTTTCATSTERERCTASCGEVGMIEVCETACETKTECQTVKETGAATATKDMVRTTTSVWMYNNALVIPTPTAASIPSCDANAGSGLPGEAFSGPNFNVTAGFCQELAKGDGSSSLSWTVDGKGQHLSPKKTKHRRAPPVNPDQYEDFKITLEWEPTSKEAGFAKKCSRFDACFDAYHSAAQGPCGRAGGGQTVMAREGTYDRGCGTYKWSIATPPKEDPGTTYVALDGPQEQFCHATFNFPGHKDVRREDVINTANKACAAAPQKFTKDTPRWQKKYTEGGTDYFYSIEWQGGCRTDVEEQDIQMLDGKTRYPNCWHMMHDSWANCDNDGVGGNRQAGCLQYTFSPHMIE
ncbi:hypothetical protein PG984_006617 [Apiospora sp. TS-2023a]